MEMSGAWGSHMTRMVVGGDQGAGAAGRFGSTESGRRGWAASEDGDQVRAFTAADKALIKRVHAFMAPAQLLLTLNERLVGDQGERARRYTMKQLQDEIAAVSAATPKGAQDWSSLRKVIAQARRGGVLVRVDEQVIQDFAVVFSLNAKQVMTLKDIVLKAAREA